MSQSEINNNTEEGKEKKGKGDLIDFFGGGGALTIKVGHKKAKGGGGGWLVYFVGPRA